MKENYSGFIKLFRRTLISEIAAQHDSVFSAFVKILLAVNPKSGVMLTSVKDLKILLRHGSKNTTYKVLETLKTCGIINAERAEGLKITVLNWHIYQPKRTMKEVEELRLKGSKNERAKKNKEVKKCTRSKSERGQKVNAKGSKNEPLRSKSELLGSKNERDINRYANVKKSLRSYKKGFKKREIAQSKPLFGKTEKNKNIQILALHFLTKTKDPVLKKSKSEISAALKNHVPHLAEILSRTENLAEARAAMDIWLDACAKGKTANLFYFAQDLPKYRALAAKAKAVMPAPSAQAKKEPALGAAELAEKARWDAMTEAEQRAELKQISEEIKNDLAKQK
jgi:hypothetical protein